MTRKLILLIVAVALYRQLFPGDADIGIIKNSLADIDNTSGKITLQLIRTWCDKDEEGYQFKTPSDIAVDSKNQVYIVDSALNCIRVFDYNGRFIRQIGRRGQGPADVLTPMRIGIDTNDTIWIFEFGNMRIQTFSETGTSISIFKTPMRLTSNLVFPSINQVALYDYYSAIKGDGIIKVFDRTGTIFRQIGSHMLPPQVNLPWQGGEYDSAEISFNSKTQKYCISYKYSQMIQLFQITGELIACIFYETPINKPGLSWNPKRRNYDLDEKKKNYSECVDLDFDNNGFTFVVVSTRLPKENERTSMVFYPGGTIIHTPRSKNYPEKTDMYRLMVFGIDGKITASKQLDVFCDGLYIAKNRIYIIDKTFAQAIYEYRYRIKQ
jgi:hypothetical protein